MSEAEKTVANPKLAAKKITPKAATPDAFAMPNIEFPEAFRDAAEKSVKQAKDAYDKMRTAAEEATDMLEDQFETTRGGFVAFNEKALDAAKANTDATFKFAKDMLAVKTFAEAIELQTAFARAQFDLVSAQAKDMQELVQKVSTEASQPMKEVFGKAFKDLKVA